MYDEVGAERTRTVKHKHNHRALVFVDDYGVARGCKLAVELPTGVGFNPTPLLHVFGTHLIAIEVGEVAECEHVEDAFRCGSDDATGHAFHTNINQISQLAFAIVADVDALDVALRVVCITHIVESETDLGVGLLCRQFQSDVVVHALVVKLLCNFGKHLRSLVHAVHFENVVNGVARQLLKVVAETFHIVHIGAAHADGIG